jgi:hypothetical protein
MQYGQSTYIVERRSSRSRTIKHITRTKLRKHRKHVMLEHQLLQPDLNIDIKGETSTREIKLSLRGIDPIQNYFRHLTNLRSI